MTRAPVLLLLLTAACSGAPAEVADHEHGGGAAITAWTADYELFYEHPPLVAGVESDGWAIHLTRLADFQPVRAGRLVVELTGPAGATARAVAPAPARDGIFTPGVLATAAGEWRVTMILQTETTADTVPAGAVTVFASEGVLPHEDDAGPGGITFLKEQQWQTPGFTTAFARTGAVIDAFDAPGQVVPAAGRAASVSAPLAGLIESEGTVRIPAPGAWVERGQPLVVLRPTLGEAGSAYAEARRTLREAEVEHARAVRLYDLEAVPARRVHEAEIALDAARAAMAGLGGDLVTEQDGRLILRAPVRGTVARRQAVPGTRVPAGTELFHLVDPAVVWLEVPVPGHRAGALSASAGATFQIEGSERVYRTARTVTVGRVLDSLTRTLTVLYEVPNADGGIPVGANARVRVGAGAARDGVVIPVSAVLDEDGRPVAYVQAEGERFERRPLTLGANDGLTVVVLDGIRAGERVVTGAAYQVRLASLSSSVPAEGHAH